MIDKQTYVMIKKTVLSKEERATNIPNDTKKCEFMMKVKGYLTSKAIINDEVTIMTDTKRLVKGTLIEVHPSYTHAFGNYVEEVQKIKEIILSEMEDF